MLLEAALLLMAEVPGGVDGSIAVIDPIFNIHGLVQR